MLVLCCVVVWCLDWKGASLVSWHTHAL